MPHGTPARTKETKTGFAYTESTRRVKHLCRELLPAVVSPLDDRKPSHRRGWEPVQWEGPRNSGGLPVCRVPGGRFPLFHLPGHVLEQQDDVIWIKTPQMGR